MSKRFINYLSKLIDSDDPDILYETVAKRELERDQARATITEWHDPSTNIGDIFNKYSDIIGWTPISINQVDNWEELGSPSGSDQEYRGINANIISGKRYIEDYWSKRDRNIGELVVWLREMLVSNAEPIANLIDKLWGITEYAAGKREWLIVYGNGDQKTYKQYALAAERKRGQAIEKITELLWGAEND